MSTRFYASQVFFAPRPDGQTLLDIAESADAKEFSEWLISIESEKSKKGGGLYADVNYLP